MCGSIASAGRPFLEQRWAARLFATIVRHQAHTGNRLPVNPLRFLNDLPIDRERVAIYISVYALPFRRRPIHDHAGCQCLTDACCSSQVVLGGLEPPVVTL